MEIMDLFGALGALAIILVVVAVAAYVVVALSFVRVLKIYNYENAWLGWIPYIQYYALADAAAEGKNKMKLFNWDIPAVVFRVWWLLPIAIAWFMPNFAIIGTIVQIVALGTVFGHIYARIENKNYNETKWLGLLSGWISIIAVIKFLMYNKDLRVVTQKN